MKPGEYTMKGWGVPMVKKCLEWKRKRIVPVNEYLFYRTAMYRYPHMIDPDYSPYEDVCVERSEEELELRLRPMPDWIRGFESHE